MNPASMSCLGAMLCASVAMCSASGEYEPSTCRIRKVLTSGPHLEGDQRAASWGECRLVVAMLVDRGLRRLRCLLQIDDRSFAALADAGARRVPVADARVSY